MTREAGSEQIGLWLDQEVLKALELIQGNLEGSVKGVKVTRQAAIRHAILETAARMREAEAQR